MVIGWEMASCNQLKPVPGTVTSTPDISIPTYMFNAQTPTSLDISQNLVDTSPSPVPMTTPIPTQPVLDAPVYGLHIHNLTSEEQVTLGEQAGVYWTRFIDFHRDSIEPVKMDPPVYQWPLRSKKGSRWRMIVGLK